MVRAEHWHYLVSISIGAASPRLAALSLVRGPQYSALIGWSRDTGPGADTDTELSREGVLGGSGNQIMGDTGL